MRNDCNAARSSPRRHPLRPFLAEVGRLPGSHWVDLPNLDRDQVAELLGQLLDRPPSQVVVDVVHRRSEGIPYFVEELTRSTTRGCIDMPDTLRDALLVRVQQLSEPAQRVLRYAAVAGNRIGQGQGHYDRALARLRESGAVRTIGIGWDVQVWDSGIPADPWDVPLDAVATPQIWIERTSE